MFIKRIHKYAVKVLKSGAGRVYIQNDDALTQAGLGANTLIRVSYSKHRIVAVEDKQGEKKIMDTGRGALLELKNKDVAKSVGDLAFVTVTFRKGKVVITIHCEDKQRLEREQAVINDLIAGKPLRKASLFSGLGMLAWCIGQGLKNAGVKTQITFANDMSEIAMQCNLAGNPIWKDASNDAYVVVDSLDGVELSELVQAHIVEVGYPCVGQTTLCKKEHRDTDHPDVGTLFVKIIAAIKAINPAMVVFENTPAFANSKTLDFIKREMKGYRFESVMLNAHEYGELEGRKRTCVVAVSEGLPSLNLQDLRAPELTSRPILSDVMEDIALDSPLWRTMDHLKRKTACTKTNHKNMLYTGEESKIATITASYAAPKAGTPMIAHPEIADLQRQVTPREHGWIRQLPKSLFDQVMAVAYGSHGLVSKNGSKTAAHRLLGNGVSHKVWKHIGEYIGAWFKSLLPQRDMFAMAA